MRAQRCANNLVQYSRTQPPPKILFTISIFFYSLSIFAPPRPLYAVFAPSHCSIYHIYIEAAAGLPFAGFRGGAPRWGLGPFLRWRPAGERSTTGHGHHPPPPHRVTATPRAESAAERQHQHQQATIHNTQGTQRAAAAGRSTEWAMGHSHRAQEEQAAGIFSISWGARWNPPRSQVPSNVIKRAHPTRLGRPLGP
jgi:hypothetical protein